MDLGTLGGDRSYPAAISNAGIVVGESSTLAGQFAHAFAWSISNGMVDLGALKGNSESDAVSVNEVGSIVGASLGADDLSRATLWHAVGGKAKSAGLRLLLSTGSPVQPLLIERTYLSQDAKRVSATITITNVTGTWYEGRATGSANSTDKSLIAFVIGPYGTKSFDLTLGKDEYLRVDVTRTSPAAFSVLAIDAIGRGLFGQNLADFSPGGFLGISGGVAGGVLDNLLSTFERNCGGFAAKVGFDLGSANWLDAIGDSAELIACTVRNPEMMRAISKLVTQLFDKNTARLWIEYGAMKIADLVFLINRLPALAVLGDQTASAPLDGFARLDAKP